MKVKNIYPDTREIAHPEFSATVESGDTAEVPDEVGESLVEQGDVWEQVKESKATKATSKENT